MALVILAIGLGRIAITIPISPIGRTNRDTNPTGIGIIRALPLTIATSMTDTKGLRPLHNRTAITIDGAIPIATRMTVLSNHRKSPLNHPSLRPVNRQPKNLRFSPTPIILVLIGNRGVLINRNRRLPESQRQRPQP